MAEELACSYVSSYENVSEGGRPAEDGRYMIFQFGPLRCQTIHKKEFGPWGADME